MLKKIYTHTTSRNDISGNAAQTNVSSHLTNPQPQRKLELSVASNTQKASSYVKTESSVISEKNIPKTKTASTKMDSPVPCGESFFEEDAILTQTHVNFMSKFKRHSLNGSNTNTPLASTKLVASTPYSVNRLPSGNYGDTSLNNSSILDNSCVSKQEANSYSFITPNKQDFDENHQENSIFDDVDDEINLQMAEDCDFENNIPSVAVTLQGDNQSKGLNYSTLTKTDNSSYPQEMSRDDFIDEFDEDEDFNEILEQETVPVSRQSSSRMLQSMWLPGYWI